jgi:hypothetical protein
METKGPGVLKLPCGVVNKAHLGAVTVLYLIALLPRWLNEDLFYFCILYQGIMFHFSLLYIYLYTIKRLCICNWLFVATSPFPSFCNN